MGVREQDGKHGQMVRRESTVKQGGNHPAATDTGEVYPQSVIVSVIRGLLEETRGGVQRKYVNRGGSNVNTYTKHSVKGVETKTKQMAGGSLPARKTTSTRKAERIGDAGRRGRRMSRV